ncbi:MAG: radical SAM protein [Endomicrobium sp.]|jgi:MoaA/NifB/PqqE/SkfB family radical SAM enzyme|uniref:radical SAM protein n=1 Tax=Candidatus Endomicrobiellum cubanum TaxID=3242325 RepID=UPI0028369D12|nr:radical SAM protein [Endomicrobium sp.]
MFNTLKKILRITKKNVVLDYLVLVTGQQCTLMCKDCGNFSPFLRHLFPFYTYKSLRKDLEILKQIVSKIKLLQIQGGEFFIHPEALDIIRYVQGQSIVEEIVIATNGTIIPSDKILTQLQHKTLGGGGGGGFKKKNKK